jgi:hypothetical protein
MAERALLDPYFEGVLVMAADAGIVAFDVGVLGVVGQALILIPAVVMPP